MSLSSPLCFRGAYVQSSSTRSGGQRFNVEWRLGAPARYNGNASRFSPDTVCRPDGPLDASFFFIDSSGGSFSCFFSLPHPPPPSQTLLLNNDLARDARRASLANPPLLRSATHTIHVQAALLTTTPTTSPKPIPDPATLVFGQTFTDHMLTAKWTLAHGWEAPEIKPYGPLALDPSSTVLHYSPTLFEGMKAYKVPFFFFSFFFFVWVRRRGWGADFDREIQDQNGVARLFRPDKNMERLNRGAARLAFPVRLNSPLPTLGPQGGGS